MRPVLFEIPLFNGIPVHAYGFFIMLGFVVGSWIAAKRGPKVGVPADFVLDLALWVMIFGIVGSRVFYVIQYRADYNWAIFDLGDGGMSILGGVLGWVLPLAWMQWKKGDPSRPKRGLVAVLVRTLAACLVLGTVFARAFYLLPRLRVDPPVPDVLQGFFKRLAYRITSLHDSMYDYGVFRIDRGGIVFYGGLFGAVLVAFWYIRRHKQSILAISDLFIPEVALGYASARIGCFLNGCCFGHPVRDAHWWTVTYPGPSAELLSGSPAWEEQFKQGRIHHSAHETLPVHPSQIYAFFAALAIFFILSWLWKRNKVKGAVLGWFGILYSVYRFLNEMTRGDEAHIYFGMSISQFISVCMFAASVVLLAVLYSRAKRAAAPAPPVSTVSDRR